MPRRDVAIYAPWSAGLLTEPPASAAAGAELQMTLLSRELARRGMRVCQVVYPRPGLPSERDGVEIVVRDPPRLGRPLGAIRETRVIADALREADARIVVHRSAGADVAVTAGWCRIARRRFIYSSSSTADFTLSTLRHRPRDVAAYRLGLRLARAVVVQTDEQRELAKALLGARMPIVTIPSIAEVVEPVGHGDYFLWIGGAATYKGPESYLRLARALPDARFVMILAGREESEAGLDPQELIKRADDIPNLTILAAMPREQALERLDHAIAVVNTSELEGMPNTFLEAWARGVPVLSFRVDPDGTINSFDLGVAANGSWPRFVSSARDLWRAGGATNDQRQRIQSFIRGHHDPEVTIARWLGILL